MHSANLYSNPDSTESSKILKKTAISFDFYQGKMVSIYANCPIVNQSKYFSINYQWQTTGIKTWHYNYGLPLIGLNLFYNYLGNDTILGRSIGICPNIVIQFRREKQWGAFLKLATGFAYFNKPYNKISNPENLIIGSHVTNMTNICLNGYIKISKQLLINGGYSVFHFSTGHISIPNYGFNDLAWNIGFRYKPSKTIYISNIKTDTSAKRILINTRISVGYHEMSGTVSPNGGPIYPIYSLSLFFSKRLGNVNNLRVGLSAKYFTSYHDFMLSEHYFKGNETQNSWVLCFLFGNEWQIGRIGFLLEPSMKFYNPFFQLKYVDENPNDRKKMEIKRWLSIKSGFSYYIRNTADKPKLNPAIGMFINTNRTQADYVDFSISCGF